MAANLIGAMGLPRRQIRKTVDLHDCMEVHGHCPLEVCRQRDPKGM